MKCRVQEIRIGRFECPACSHRVLGPVDGASLCSVCGQQFPALAKGERVVIVVYGKGAAQAGHRILDPVTVYTGTPAQLHAQALLLEDQGKSAYYWDVSRALNDACPRIDTPAYQGEAREIG